jgi:hypothetical protein
MSIIIYLAAVIVACVILPFLSGYIDLNGQGKQALILKMGRMIRAYNQTGNEDYLQVAQCIAHELTKLGVKISTSTQSKLMGA